MKRKRHKSNGASHAKGGIIQATEAVPIPPIRQWCFRLLFLLFPLLVLGLLEVGLRVAGFGYPTGFFLKTNDHGRVMLAENPRFGWRFFPAAISRTPRPMVLSQKKPPGTCRIFVFGESAAYGDPSPAFGLPRVLEVLLRNRYPGVRFEVVNVAMTAVNSNVILPITEDCAREDGDVWVFYMGNNEVVGPYGGGTVFGAQVPRRSLIRASIWANSTKIGQMIASLRDSLARKKSGQPSNISLALFLNHRLRHDDPRMERVYGHFAQNLADMLRNGTESQAKVVVSTMASNLKDCAPFASLHRADLSESQIAEWNRLYQAGTNADQAGKLSEALEAYGKAANIDDQWADLQFRQARDLWLAGDFAAALHHFVLARDYDVLRFRADSRLNDIIRNTSSNRLDEGIAFLDGNEVLARQSPHGVPGVELLYEHVHLNQTGNYYLARAIAEQISLLKPPVLVGQVPANGDWLSEEKCFAQLGLNDWDRLQTYQLLRDRLETTPYSLQLNHLEQQKRVQQEIARCTSALSGQTLAEGVERCTYALSLNPGDWTLHQKLAELLKQSSSPSDQARAAEEWRQVIALVPQYPEAHYELGVLLDRNGKAEEAEAQLRLAVKLRWNYYPSALNALGRLLAGQNRLPEAVEQFERAVQLKPNFVEALVNLGSALDRLGRKDEAKARLAEAVRLAPDNSETAVKMGKLLDEKGELSAALARCAEAVRAEPNNAVAHFNLARCLGLLGRSAEAQEHYAQALRIQPDFAEAHSQFGVELARSGKETEALGHFREAVRLQPDSASSHKSLGIALARQRKFEEAVEQFEQSLRLDPTDALAQKYLEEARRFQGGTGR